MKKRKMKKIKSEPVKKKKKKRDNTKERKKDIISRTSLIVISICLYLIILVTIASVLSTSIGFYNSQFSRLGIDKKVEGCENVSAEIINYLRLNNDETPKITGFNERENLHVMDVKDLLNNAKKVALALVLITNLAIISMILWGKKNNMMFSWIRLMKYLSFTTIIMTIGILVIGIFFDSFFMMFHELLFVPGTYMFNPNTEMIINIFPPEFFLTAAERIMIWMMTIGVALAAISWILEKMFFVSKK